MKMRKVLMLLAAMMLIGSTACAEEAEVSGAEAVAEQAAAGELSDDWKDYQIQIDDQVYQFPMMYSDFVALGWTTDEAEDVELEPYQYDSLRFTKDGAKCTVYVLNLGKNTVPAEECIVGGIDIDSYDWDLSVGTITLPGGIVRGVSDGAAIEAVYGTPSDTYEGDLYKEYTYETDSYSYVEMKVYTESGVLESVTVRNFIEPEGYDPGEVSEEVPEAVAAYTKPDALSENLTDYQIEFDGQVYALPVPVSVLAADGWEIDESDSDPEISAGYFGWATLRKGGLEISTTVHNPENYATIPENCWVEELTVGGYDMDVEGALPGGITVGMTEADFLQILEDAGVTYELESDSGDYKYYTYNEESYDQCFQVVIYAGDDGYFEKDTVMKFSCSNPVE